MEFTRKMVPVKFYSGLTAQQFANLEKSDDIFYQVDNDGLYKGSKKIASVGNNTDLETYINQQINNVRNQFNAVQNGDGTITLTVKGVSYTLVAASGGSVTPSGDYEMSGSIDNEFASRIWEKRNGYDPSEIFSNVVNMADSNELIELVGGSLLKSSYKGYINFEAYYFESSAEALNVYQKNSGACKIRIGNFVYIQYNENGGSTSNDGEVVIIDQPYTETHYTDSDGGTVYEITQGSGKPTPTGIEFAGYNMSLQEGQSYVVAANSPVSFTARFTGGEPAQNETISYRITNTDKGYTINGSSITFTTTGDYIVEAYNTTYNVSKSLPFTVVSGLSIAYNMNGPVEFIPGQTWEQWVNNMPRTLTNMNYGSFYMDWSVSNGEVFLTTTKPSEVSQQDFNAVYPMKLYNVASTDAIVANTFYYLELATDNYLVADNTALGEGEFNFTINGKSFRATEGMTLSQWVSSAYNTAGFEVKSVYSNPYAGFMDENATITPYVLIKYTNDAIFNSAGKALMALGTSDTVITSSSAFTLYMIGMSHMYDPYFYISGGTGSFEVGETGTIYLTLQNYSGAGSVLYTATLSDPTIASVSVNGDQIVCTGLKEGTATLTVSCSVTDNIDTHNITVLAATPQEPEEPEEEYMSISALKASGKEGEGLFFGVLGEVLGGSIYHKIHDTKNPEDYVGIHIDGELPELGSTIYFSGNYESSKQVIYNVNILN